MPEAPDVDDVIDRFVADIQECIEAVNKALPHFGKKLSTLNANPQLGRIDIEIEDNHQVIH